MRITNKFCIAGTSALTHPSRIRLWQPGKYTPRP